MYKIERIDGELVAVKVPKPVRFPCSTGNCGVSVPRQVKIPKIVVSKVPLEINQLCMESKKIHGVRPESKKQG